MIVECSSCHAKYKYEESRFEGKKAKKIKCAKCASVFEVTNPSFETVPAGELSDATVNRKEASPAGSAAQRPTSTSAPAHDPTVDTTKELRISRDLIGAEPGSRLTDTKKFSLAVISGPDAGKIYPLDRARTVIGRSGADLVLNDTEISRKHCAVEVRDERVVLIDLGSTNGTFVDEEKVTESQLSNQSEFYMGASTLMLIITDKE